MPGVHRLGFTLHNVLTSWDTSPFALLTLVTCVVVGAWYLQAVWALSAKGRIWSRMRTVSFLVGLVMIDLALQSPVATFTMGYFEAHMVQHLLLMVTAPPLLALGAPMTLALQTSSRPVKVRMLGVLNSRVFKWWSHPVPTAAVYYFAMFAFFLTSGIDVAMQHMWVMDVVNIAFLVASLHFWWPIVGIDNIPHWPMSHGAKMVALLIGVPIESFLALALLTSTRPVASMYTVGSTHAGAGILWIGAEVFTFLALIPVFIQWLRFEGRRTARIDAELDATYAEAGTSLTAVSPDVDRSPAEP
ncbi:MAG TPA: cytochrome c oxidase assembly protein [Acidimicrobiales bacterium]|jgi:cytochrome c oxidase assembly factor CtaG